MDAATAPFVIVALVALAAGPVPTAPPVPRAPLAPPAPPAQAADAGERALRREEIDILKPVFDKYYGAGASYYEKGWRGEALWCFERATEVLPEAGGLRRLVSLLRDFDNPIWKRKRWKSPHGSSELTVQKRTEQFDLAYAQALLKLGAKFSRKGADATRLERAHRDWLRALELVGGPYDVDGEGRLVAGRAGTIPADASARLLAEDLVLINGKRWVRDSMLRSLKDLSEVQEARSDRIVVRTTTTKDAAQTLLRLLELAYPAYEKQLGARSTPRLLGLFVFPDRAAYQKWCHTSKNDRRELAAGFASSVEGFAVTYQQQELERVAVHEVAHLWFFDVYATAMPSWYSEGAAEFFGARDAMRYADGKLEIGLKPTRAALVASLRDGRLRIGLADLLNGDAGDRISAQDGSAENFYRESWALYWFLTTTGDPRFAARFADWEDFSLGSRWSAKDEERSGGALFQKIFSGRLGELESAFTEWCAAPE